MYVRYNKDLEILAFPCNNFGAQEPGTNKEVVDFVNKKGVTFPVLGKLECENGAMTAPLFTFLRSSVDLGPYALLGPGL